MSNTDQLTEIRARFLAWFANLSASGVAGGEKSSGASRDDLVLLLDKGRPGQRWLAAEALGETDPGRNGVAALTAALRSDDPILRAEAGNALAHVGGRAGRSALLESAADSDPVVQAAAADALGRMPADEATAAALQTLLDSPLAAVRQSAAEALARAGWPRASRSAEPVASPTPRLLALLADDTDPMVRRAAALALGKLGDPDARDALLARRDNPVEDRRVREAAALAESRLPVPAPVAVEAVVQSPPEASEVDESEATSESPKG
ncbi:MAG: HEAT repeat domain-containing protein [Anaerolineae bacterium]|nr:HEAT repeat domain-containing protein [Anaerolineae bacterium]